MKKCLSIMLLGLLVISCGKKGSDTPGSMGIVDTLTTNKSFGSSKAVNEQACIDDVLAKELNTNETVKKIEDEADINFCNGLRVRVKVFKISNGELRTYGYAESSSKRTSCLRNGSDFQKVPFAGYHGTLYGDKIKISLGGHQYSSEGKLIKSDRLKGKFVKLNEVDYSGEMGFFENNSLVCWAQH